MYEKILLRILVTIVPWPFTQLMRDSKPILLLLTDTQAIGGISRFNINLLNALDSYSLKTLVLNDLKNEHTKGFGKEKIQFSLSALFSILSRPKMIIIGHLHFVPFAFLSFIFGIKSMVILHGVEAWKPKKGLSTYFRFVDQFWSVSKFTQQKFLEATRINPNKKKLIFNTLPKEWDAERSEITDSKKILSITRLDLEDGYKGIDKVLYALAELRKEIGLNSWEYIVVGDGTALQLHQDLAYDLGISNMVTFRKNIGDEELKHLLSSCSFFVLPSTGEGFGIVYLEAMSFQKAAIGAINSGAEEVILDGETGFLIEPGIEELKRKITWMIENPQKRSEMGLAGFNHLNKHFVFRKFHERINKLISESTARE